MIRFMFGAALCSLLTACPNPEPKPTPVKDTAVEPSGEPSSEAHLFENPSECQDCHPVQFEEWQGSMHAASSPTFAALNWP